MAEARRRSGPARGKADSHEIPGSYPECGGISENPFDTREEAEAFLDMNHEDCPHPHAIRELLGLQAQKHTTTHSCTPRRPLRPPHDRWCPVCSHLNSGHFACNGSGTNVYLVYRQPGCACECALTGNGPGAQHLAESPMVDGPLEYQRHLRGAEHGRRVYREKGWNA